MRIYIRYLAILIVLALPLKGEAIGIKDILSDACKYGIYIAPSERELKDVRSLFELLFRGIFDDRARVLSKRVGLRLIEFQYHNEKFIILKEDDDKRRGRGIMIFRPEDYRGFAIQVPHAFTDIHTRDIGLRLFLDGKAKAVIFNTVKRQYTKNEVKINADMTHIGESYFTVFARAFASTHPSGYIIQLHGFLKNKRKTPSGRQSDVIISSARSTASQISVTIYNCLRENMNKVISLYPYDVRELGGRTNTIASALNSMGFNGFVHIEMSRVMRDLLIKDKGIYKGFEGCLIQ
jgi:hypothetical protein